MRLYYGALIAFGITIPLSYLSISRVTDIDSYVSESDDAEAIYGNVYLFTLLYIIETLAGYLVISIAPALWFREGKSLLAVLGAVGVFGRVLVTGGRIAGLELILVSVAIGLLYRRQRHFRVRLGAYLVAMFVVYGGLRLTSHVTQLRMATETMDDYVEALIRYHSAGPL